MKSVRDSIRANSGEIHVIPFDDRPGKLFEGLEHCRSAIWLSSGERNNGCVQSTTRYQRWNSSVRSFLFPTITFAKNVTGTIFPDLVPKYDSDLESEVFRTVTSNSSTTIGAELSNASTKSFCFYQEATQYWVKAIFGLPFYAKNGIEGTPAHGRYLYFASAKEVHSVTALLNSSLFYAYFIAYSDCFHLSQTLVEAFPIPETLLSDQVLIDLNKTLMRDLAQNAETKIIRTRDGDEIKYAEFVVGRSKPIIDSIDRRLGEVYGLSDQQTEFLVNYDFKYRMGSQNE